MPETIIKIKFCRPPAQKSYFNILNSCLGLSRSPHQKASFVTPPHLLVYCVQVKLLQSGQRPVESPSLSSGATAPSTGKQNGNGEQGAGSSSSAAYGAGKQQGGQGAVGSSSTKGPSSGVKRQPVATAAVGCAQQGLHGGLFQLPPVGWGVAGLVKQVHLHAGGSAVGSLAAGLVPQAACMVPHGRVAGSVSCVMRVGRGRRSAAMATPRHLGARLV